MPLQSTSGAASYDAFGGGVAAVSKYIEDYFSTFLYSGTGSSQTINNGIDLATKGGLVWIKSRSAGFESHRLTDSARGTTKQLKTNGTDAQTTNSDTITAFNTTGFTLGTGATLGDTNASGETYVGWSLAKAPKFFDVVTYTGDGTAGRTVAHNLGSVPGSIIVKSTSSLTNWHVYHRSLAVNQNLLLDLTQAARTDNSFNSTAPTATVFSLGGGATNTNGETYVAYLFAHNAGGFGLTGTDNVISCGSFTPDSSGNVDVNLGYEPQWILFKRSAVVGSWSIADTMRGMSYSDFNRLYANLSNAEDAQPAAYCVPTATGFKSVTTGVFSANEPHIYIAIRRGPMKVPTSGTSVFSPIASEANAGTVNTTNFPVDLQINRIRGVTNNTWAVDRLRGVITTTSTIGNAPYLSTNLTNAEASSTLTSYWNNTGFQTANTQAGWATIYYNFRRAPSFFDEVCYTGNGVNGRAITHNLGVAPEMIIVKKRTGADGWVVWASGLTSRLYELYLNDARAQFVEASPRLNVNNAPTSTQFEVGTDGEVNASGATYVSYLFATCAGVSKVGSYTGTGTTLQVNCGFTGGARFVLIKRTDSTGDWYVWDSARGIVSGNDPYLLLNSTAAEVTSTDYIDTYSAGFEISSTAPAAINASGGTFIFLAIA